MSEASEHQEKIDIESPGTEDSRSEQKGQDFWAAIRAAMEAQKKAPPLEAVSREQDLPLSFAQDRLWSLAKIGSNSAYNIPYTFRLQGSLSPQVLEQSLLEVLARHEALRTSFLEVDGKPIQVISADIDGVFETHDLQELSSESQDTKIKQLVQANISQPFDLGKPPLLRVKLLQLGPEKSVLSLCVNHIVFDGWSEGLFFSELGEIYGAHCREQSPAVPELPIQYADFSVWQRSWIASGALAPQVSYWEKQLKDCSSVILPTDHEQPSFPAMSGKRQVLTLTSSLQSALEALSKESGTTLFVTLLTAFQALLYRYVGQEDITVCSPVAGRNRPEIQNLIGYFNNIVPLRCHVSGESSFKTLLDHVRVTSLDAFKHQDVPFQQLGDIQGLLLPSISKVLFALLNTQNQPFQLSDVQIEAMAVPDRNADFDLSFFWEEGEGGLVGALEYKTDLFEAETIAAFLKNYQSLLNSIVENPEQAISSIELVEAITYTPRQSVRPMGGANVTPQTQIEKQILEIWQDVLGLSDVGIHDNFFEIGGGSLLLAQVHGRLTNLFESDFAPLELFKYPTVHSLAQFLTQAPSEGSSFQAVKDRVQRQKQRRRSGIDGEDGANAVEGIAIVGLAGRFPGSHSVEQFWQNLCEGVESITSFTDEELLAAGVDPVLLGQPGYVKSGAVIDDIELFDEYFFGFSPREASALDPQHRIMLECAWEALENAGYDPDTFPGRIGVYAGALFSSYWHNNILSRPDFIQTMGAGPVEIANDKDFLATRIAYKFDLKGPAFSVNTACSTSLVATHLACQSLMSGECDMAMAGGVTINVPHRVGHPYEEGWVESADGHCRPFDVKAQGTVLGNGAGIVVLKRLEDALNDGDHIYSVIKSTALNNDGSLKVGFSAPSVDGQADVVAEAHALAGIEPESIAYIEAHGTGTQMGDPIEVAALTKVFREQTERQGFCALGSIKSNIGHLNRAAGVIGLIKTALVLKNKQIPPVVNFETPNPQLDLENSPFYLNTELQPWDAASAPRRAGLSSFGVGGTNAHAVLEESPQIDASGMSRSWQLLLLSGKTEEALAAAVENFADYLTNAPQDNLPDIAYTSKVGRRAFEYRAAVVCESGEDAIATLKSWEPDEAIYAPDTHQPSVVFMLSGQGAQYVNMGRDLYETETVYREMVDRCAEILKPHLDLDLREIIYNASGDAAANTALLKQTRITQPALFVTEYAVAQLWLAWGIQPQAMIGHSIGEYTAACLAGVFSLEEALALVAERGRLMQSLPAGSMLTVFLPEEEVKALLNDQLALATSNAPSLCTVAGPAEAIDALKQKLEVDGIDFRTLHTSHAFHSFMMEPILEPFTERVQQVKLNPPQIPYISNVTGTWITDEQATDPSYWANHLRSTVRFTAGVKELLEDETRVLLEVGPGRMLKSLASKQTQPERVVLNSIRHPKEEASDVGFILETVGQLWQAGVKLDWTGFYADEKRHRVPLPTYPFQRHRHWVDPAPKVQGQVLPSGARRQTMHPLLGQRLHLAGMNNICFESQVSSAIPAFLKDHRLFDTAVMPATGYLELALSAGASLTQSEHLTVEEVKVQRALALPDDEAQTLQCVLNSEGPQTYSFQIFSLTELKQTEPVWTLHASGRVRSSQEVEAPPVDLSALKAAHAETIPAAAHYQKFAEQGIGYGEAFQGVKQLWTQPQQVLGEIELPATVASEIQHFKLHPALLDACLQVVGALFSGEQSDDTYVPVSLAALDFYRAPETHLWCHAQQLQRDEQSLTATLTLLDDQGNVVARIRDLALRRASREALMRSLQQNVEEWLYEYAWEPRDIGSGDAAKTPSNWLIFTDQSQVGEQLAASLQDKGHHCTLIHPAATYGQQGDRYTVNPEVPGDVEKLLSALELKRDGGYGVVHLGSLDQATKAVGSQTLAEIQQTQTQTCGGVLHLIQALSQANFSPSVWLVTAGAQAVGQVPETVQVQQSPLWGLGRVIALEHPELHCKLVDLDPFAAADKAAALLGEVTGVDLEKQVAYRQDIRYTARLVRRAELKPAEQPFQLKLKEYGILENLALEPLQRSTPGPEQVEVEVRATGLNFKDVLTVLGKLQDYFKTLGLEGPENMPFGYECAGTITTVGEGVTDFAVGDAVIVAIATNCLSSHVIADTQFVIPKPLELSFEEAVTIPTNYLTAYYGLHTLAEIKKGDRILIHAAAGGVGQAAVQLAQRAGAEVFATASPGKWAFLKSMGVQHVMNSRTLDFAEEVLAITNGEGVDIVLNSLAGDFMTKTFDTIGRGGRFLELGKIGLWTQEEAKALGKDIHYMPYDLGDDISIPQPARIKEMLTVLMAAFEDGSLRPLPFTAFPMQDYIGAFRFMAQAKHIGKVVISQPPQPNLATEVVQTESTYLVTGGLGALGLELAKWLSKQGADHVVLTGRRGASPSAQAAIDQIQEAGTQVHVVTADVSKAEDVERTLKEIEIYPPLRGIIHAAGVLDDGLLMSQSCDRIHKVMEPKVNGAWHLHKLTQKHPLDFMVFFSSVAALLGAQGQGNYAAANAFMDGLAHYRQSLGLPGLSLSWGPWADVGMAASMGERERARLASQGISSIPVEQGLQALEQMIVESRSNVGVLPVNWSTFLQRFPGEAYTTLLSELASPISSEASVDGDDALLPIDDLLQQLKTASEEESNALLLPYLQVQSAEVLGLPASRRPKPKDSLNRLGLDSLMGVELRTRLQSQLQIDISMEQLIGGSTLQELTGELLKKLRVANILLPDSGSSDELEEEMEEFFI